LIVIAAIFFCFFSEKVYWFFI